jgi:hypothetical protein
VSPSRISFAFAVVLLSACGGGGGGGSAGASAAAPARPNRSPTISGAPPAFALQGRGYAFQPAAEDPDGDALGFVVTNAPSWATFSPTTGRLSGLPRAADVGSTSNITIAVTDGSSLASIGPFSITVTAVASGAATLSWTTPLQNSDGTPLTDLVGYRIYFGTQSDDYTNSADVDLGLSTFVVDQLTPSSWYFAIAAVNAQGLQSRLSNEVSSSIR